MGTPKLEACDRVLVVEGYGDVLFYAEALESINVSGVFIKDVGGKGNFKAGGRESALGTALETFLNPALLDAKRSIGVIADADNAPAGTVASLSERLSKISGQEVRHGVWTSGRPKIGLLVVPASDQPGEIETLVWDAWSNDPANAAAKRCVDAFLTCMTSSGPPLRSPDKARISAILAARYDEDPRLGPGARAKIFDFERPELAPLLNFLRGI